MSDPAVYDASQLHGLLAHLTAVNAEVISLRPLESPPSPIDFGA